MRSLTKKYATAMLFLLGGSSVSLGQVDLGLCVGGTNNGGICQTSADCPGGCTPNANRSCLTSAACPGSNTCTDPLPGTCDLDALPVELTIFEAVAVSGGTVELRWETATETNNAGFQIEHRMHGEFVPIDFIEGAGTTREAQAYSRQISGLEVNRHVFRLKQIDLDGAFEYSEEVEVEVEVPGSIVVYEAYPNPFSESSTLRFAVSREQGVSVSLYDAEGRLVSELFEGSVSANSTQSVTIDGSSLAAGVYVARIAGDAFAETRRIVLTK